MFILFFQAFAWFAWVVYIIDGAFAMRVFLQARKNRSETVQKTTTTTTTDVRY